MSKTVADLILEQLTEYGVKYIYGVIGDAIFPLADALARQEKIHFVPATIETSASFMASYSAKLYGTLGVCVGTSGPGAVNLANGTADAYLDNAPVLCLTGQVNSDKLGTDYKQYINQTEFFQAITAKSRLCTHPKTVIPILTGLINQALTIGTAVHLEIPQDILAQATTETIIPAPHLMTDLGGTKLLLGRFDLVLEMMERAKRPLLIIGKRACRVAGTLASFAEPFGAAVVVSRECKGAIPDHNPQVIGGVGEAYLPNCFLESDCILVFGEVVYEERFIPPQTGVIQIRNTILAGSDKYLEITGDYDLILREIRAKFPQFITRDEWRSRIELTHQERVQVTEQVTDPKHPLRFFKTLSQVLTDNAIITLDVGEFVYWFDFGFLAKSQQVLLSTNWRSMGGGIPAGIAACLQNQGRQVISIVGDGGFLMSMSELATIQRYRLPLIIFVMRNQCYGLEIQKMAKEGFKPFGTDLVLPNLIMLAESFNIRGYRLTETSEENELLHILQNPPALVEVVVSTTTLPNL
jgi:pyruvate oxidase